MKFFKKPSAVFVLFCIYSLLSSQAVLPQDFSSIDTDLQALENWTSPEKVDRKLRP
jgi:hypothetical protein